MSSLKQLVIVDDDQDILDIVVAFFKPKGYSVVTYTSAEAALKDATTLGKSWGVVISDLNLPRMSGVEFTLRLKKVQPHLSLILITSTKSTDVAIEAINKGAYDFLLKPLHFPQLLISVERAFRVKELKSDISELRKHVKSSKNRGDLVIGRSPKFLAALDVAQRVAPSHANILIEGESGTGKEVFAKFIHNQSKQSKGPLIAINCSAIPENLLESELFGYAKGAFTGAHEKKMGLFEEAENGTLFLDEIGDLSYVLQAKLLRVLQEKKIKRVGENQQRPINCRIISATHKNLIEEVQNGKFREDLFFRLNVIPIKIPALRDRPEDILFLAEAFLRKFTLINGSDWKTFSSEAMRYIVNKPWRGNVRELENFIERAVVLSTSREIQVADFLPPTTQNPFESSMQHSLSTDHLFSINCADGLVQLDSLVQKYIEFAVLRNNGAKDKTARDLNIDRKTVYKRTKSEEKIW